MNARWIAFMLVGVAVFESADTRAQSRVELRSRVATLDSVHIAFLNTGNDNASAEAWYATSMDSLLNAAYRGALALSSATQQSSLQRNERKWLLKRNRYIKSFRRSAVETDGEGSIAEQVTFEAEAEFVRARVLYLIKKLPDRK